VFLKRKKGEVMARPEKHTVEYFPFYVKDGKTLFILESKYRAAGTGFFTNVFRFLSETPDHYCCLKDAGDRSYFFAKTKVNEEEGIDMLNMMADTGKIDKDLWITHSVIASQDFLNSIKDAYEKRKNKPTTLAEIKAKFISGNGNGINTPVNPPKTIVSPFDNTQTKLKETKLNYIKEYIAAAPVFIPTKEEIENYSTPKIQDEIEKFIDLLYRQEVFKDALIFTNKALKENKNPRAVLHTLIQCFSAKPEKPWGYCEKIIKIESMNYNERDHIRASQ